jgi:Fe2+ or Zn2+ uptake regulation protein
MIMNNSAIKSYRYSRQRQRILEFLQDDFSHPSALELYQALKPEMPSLSLGNLYRNLHILEEQSLILKISPPGSNEDRYDGHVHQHIHFRCGSCHKIFDIDMLPDLKNTFHTLSQQGFTTQEMHISLGGTCPNCAS